jgi:hypothetical protein
LVATSITDNRGRYAFLVGQNDYVVRFEKDGYDPEIKEVNVDREEGVIKENVALHKPLPATE